MARRVPLDDVTAAIRILEEDGAVIVTNFTTPEQVETVNSEASPYLDALVKDRTSKGLRRGTIHSSLLFGRSVTARETWLQQPHLHRLLDHFLRGQRNSETLDTAPTLSASATLDIGPGEAAQSLHRDDFIWQQIHTDATKTGYRQGRDVGMGVLVPGVDTCQANGATRLVLGSHLWGCDRLPKVEETIAAEMSVGEALIFLASAFHGGGENTTQKSRSTHGFFFCRSIMRPEENQHIWWSRNEVLRWSPKAQQMAGYTLDSPFLGHCQTKNPLDLLSTHGIGDTSDQA